MNSDPPRLLSPGSDASSATRDLLRAAQVPSPMTHADHVRMEARLEPQLGPTATPHATPGIGNTWLFRMTAVVGSAAVLITAGLLLRRPPTSPPPQRAAHVVTQPSAAITPRPAPPAEPPPPPAVSATQTPDSATPIAAVASAQPPLLAARPRTTISTLPPRPAQLPTVSRTIATRTTSDHDAGGLVVEDSLGRETSLLESARTALRSSPANALRLLATYDREGFQRPQLLDWRRYLEIDALRALGRREEARTRAEDFVRQFHDSLYLHQVRRWLDSDL